jgi:uncharacterized protein (DUF1330 family)
VAANAEVFARYQVRLLARGGWHEAVEGKARERKE